MSLMEDRKEQLKFELLSLADSTPVDPLIGGFIMPIVEVKTAEDFVPVLKKAC